MKKVLSAFLAFITAALFSLNALAAETGVPSTGDSGVWMYVLLVLVAVALVAFLVMSGKKK